MFDLPDIVTIWPPGINNGFGEEPGEPVEAAARIAYKNQKITDFNGDDAVSKAVFYCESPALVEGAIVLLGSSNLVPVPPDEADDVIQITQTPTGAGAMKKGWM